MIRQPLSRDLQKVMEQVTQTSREEGARQPGKGSEVGVCFEYSWNSKEASRSEVSKGIVVGVDIKVRSYGTLWAKIKDLDYD